MTTPLWPKWLDCVRQLRPACTRTRTFLLMTLALMGFSIRSDLAGVTSLVRATWLQPKIYKRLLNLFHTPAINLSQLTTLWIRLVLKCFRPLSVNGRPVLVADGIKVPKEGRKMPSVKKLYQPSDNNSKPEYIFGHAFEAIGLLVLGPLGRVVCVPLLSRIHEGLVFSNRDKRSLLDKFVQMFLPITPLFEKPTLLVADALYCTRKVILPLLAKDHHLVSRMKSNAVAFQPATSPKVRKRGRPRFYGEKIRLRELWKKTPMLSAQSPVYGERDTKIQYFCHDLLWRPVGRMVRLVFVQHPKRGRIILMSSDTSLDPLTIVAIYGYRFKIEIGFKQALHTLGGYAYHFWMQAMQPRTRRSGNQHLHKKDDHYRRMVRRKMDAYHRYVQLACIAQGLQQLLAIDCRRSVWSLFRGFLRTMRTEHPPSEAVVAQALRNSLPDFLFDSPDDHEFKKFVLENIDYDQCQPLRLAG